MVLCAEQCGSSLEITPILSSRLSTYWAGLDLAWILICNQYVVSCKHLLGVCFLLGRSCIWLPFSNTHADAAGCEITREKSLWILTKKKKEACPWLCVLTFMHLLAPSSVANLILAQRFETFMFIHISPAVHGQQRAGRAQFIVSVWCSCFETGDMTQWVFIPLIFAVSDLLLLQYQLCAGFSTLLSSQCK